MGNRTSQKSSQSQFKSRDQISRTFSGALLWPYWHPWPQQPKGLVKAGFEELAKRWVPILDVFEDNDVNACFEVHPGEDIHDGETFEMFLEASNNHKRANILYDPSHFVLQQLDYVTYIDHYHEFIKAFHVKDSEFKPNGKKGPLEVTEHGR